MSNLFFYRQTECVCSIDIEPKGNYGNEKYIYFFCFEEVDF